MLDLVEIENTIEELENADTTFDTCIKLSALYNVREHLKSNSQTMVNGLPNNVTKELADILPHYEKYINAKTNYQLNKVGEEVVVEYMSALCVEIDEFIRTLYSSTDMSQERFLLYNSMLQTVSRIKP